MRVVHVGVRFGLALISFGLLSAAGCAALVDFPDVPGLEGGVEEMHRPALTDARAHHDGASKGRPDATVGGDARVDAPRAREATTVDAGVDASDAPCCECKGGTTTGDRCLVLLAAEAGLATGIALDDGHVYWTDLGSNSGAFVPGRILKVDKLGVGGTTALASGRVHPFHLVVAHGTVYWTELGAVNASLQFVDGSVEAVSIDGGLPTVVASQVVTSYGIVADDASVYWINNASAGKIQSLLLTDGVISVQSAPGDPILGIAVLDGIVYLTTGTGVDGGVVVAPSGKQLATDQASPWALVAAGNSVYWTTRGGPDGSAAAPSVVSFDLIGGGEPVTLATAPGGFPYALAIDDANLYWTDTRRNVVLKIALTGGTPTTLASVPDGSFLAAIAVDDASVYWAERNAVMKLTPK